MAKNLKGYIRFIHYIIVFLYELFQKRITHCRYKNRPCLQAVQWRACSAGRAVQAGCSLEDVQCILCSAGRAKQAGRSLDAVQCRLCNARCAVQAAQCRLCKACCTVQEVH